MHHITFKDNFAKYKLHQEELATPPDVVPLGQAELEGTPLPPHPSLLHLSPLPPLGCCSCSIPKVFQPIKEHSGLTPCHLYAQDLPDLASVARDLCFLAVLCGNIFIGFSLALRSQDQFKACH